MAWLWKNCLENHKKQRTNSEGQELPLKKCAVLYFGNAMPQLGQQGAFPTGQFVFYGAALIETSENSV